jgi:hypothetical protein
MTKEMDAERNGKMDWFFNQWVYGTEIPSYKLEYTLTPGQDGKVLLKGTVAQSGVSDEFKMLVPVYVDFDGQVIRLGTMGVAGSSTTPEFQVMLPRRPARVLINAFQDILAEESVSNERKAS